MRRYVATLAAKALIAAVAVFPAAAIGAVVDGIPNSWELRHRLSLNVNQAKLDADRDRLNNLNEYRSRTSPRAVDTDRDGVPDANEDADGDGVTNLQEQQQETHPADVDTDNDGVTDADEPDGDNNADDQADENDDDQGDENDEDEPEDDEPEDD